MTYLLTDIFEVKDDKEFMEASPSVLSAGASCVCMAESRRLGIAPNASHGKAEQRLFEQRRKGSFKPCEAQVFVQAITKRRPTGGIS